MNSPSKSQQQNEPKDDHDDRENKPPIQQQQQQQQQQATQTQGPPPPSSSQPQQPQSHKTDQQSQTQQSQESNQQQQQQQHHQSTASILLGQHFAPPSQHHLYAMPSAASVSPVHAAAASSNTSQNYHQSSLSHSSFFDTLSAGAQGQQHQEISQPTHSPLLLDIPPFNHEEFQSQDTKDTHYDYYNPLSSHDPPDVSHSPRHSHQQHRHHLSQQQQHQQHQQQHHHHNIPRQQQQQQQQHELFIDPIDPLTLGGGNTDPGLVMSSYTTASPSNLFKRKGDLMDHPIPVSKKPRLDEGGGEDLGLTATGSGAALTDPQSSATSEGVMSSSSHTRGGSISSGTKRSLQRSTAWTRSEEDRLQVLVDAGVKWSDITREFPNRSAGAIKKHYYADMKHTAWSEEEDLLLQQSVREDEENKWRRISEKVGKPAKACEKRMREIFRQNRG